MRGEFAVPRHSVLCEADSGHLHVRHVPILPLTESESQEMARSDPRLFLADNPPPVAIDDCGCPMMPSYSKKKGVTYYYYLCEKHEKGTSECPVKKVSAGMVEQLVQEQLNKVFHSHDVLSELSKRTQMSQRMISDIFQEDFWTQVTAAEFTRLSQLILDKVTLFEDHMEMDIKSGGMESIMEEFTENDA